MTSLFDLDSSVGGPGDASVGGMDDVGRAQRVLDDASAFAGLSVALDHALAVGGAEGIRRLNAYRGRIAATETLIAAETVAADGSTRDTERLLNDGKTSTAERRKRAKRAKAVAKNSALADKLADDSMSEEQVDVIADASDKTDGEAAIDQDLIDRVAAVPPERGKTIVDEYVADRATKDGVQSEHDRQRTLRKAKKYYSKKHGLDVVSLDGDAVTAKAVWDAIETRSKEIYQRDGGRELPTRAHPRTRDQRCFDAAV